MAYLRRLTLKNVEGHKNSILEFSPGVNFITGSSHVGKSSIFRALNWVFSNRTPKGGLTPWDNPKATVHVICEFADGTVIERKKGQGLNCYVINGNVLKAVGSAIPEEVLEALKITEVNFQPQHAAYFLLSDPPSKITAQFNELANFEFFDELIGETARYLREVRGEKKLISEQIEEEVETIASLKEVDLAYQQFGHIETLFEDCQQIEEAIESLNEIVTDITTIQQDLSAIEGVEDALIDLRRLAVKVEEVSVIEEEHTRLKNLTNKVEALSSSLQDFQDVPQALTDVSKLIDIVIGTQQLAQDVEELRRLVRRLGMLSADLSDIEECLRLSKIISAYVTLYDEYFLLIDAIENIRGLKQQIDSISEQVQKHEKEIEAVLQKGCPFMEHCPLIR